MPQVIEQGDIFGRIGKAFGEGAGGAAVDQWGKNRIANALQPKEGESFDPLSQIGRLTKAGASAQEISQYLPLIQQAQERIDFIEANRNKTPTSQIVPQQDVSEKPKGLSSFQNFEPLLGTTEGLQSRARVLMAEQPSLYRDPNKALAKAKEEFDTQDKVLKDTGAEFEKTVSKRLQKYGKEIDESILGDMQQDYLREAQALAATGKMSAEKAADKLSKDLLDFAKARTNLKGMTITSGLGSFTPKKVEQANLQALRKEYADKDQLELFENDLINNLGLSSPIASYLSFPIKSNKEINNFAKDTKKRFSANFKDIHEKGGKGGVKRTEKQIADFISDNLKDNDSLISIASSFNAKGYDPQIILKEIENNPKARLDKRQQQELQKRPSFRPTMRDIAYFAATGLEPKEIIP